MINQHPAANQNGVFTQTNIELYLKELSVVWGRNVNKKRKLFIDWFFYKH